MEPDSINSAIEKLEAALAELKAAKREIESVCEVNALGRYEIKTWDKRGFASRSVNEKRFARYTNAENTVNRIRFRFSI